ncbi:MAG TPA: PAS domain S-box protein [Candidatus Baltobacteraceae bacterium]|jgi:PAS domain S-box-containing protein|nr:PAS domain S-box protein [Candidatus Baltobacteraceae bacterium]
MSSDSIEACSVGLPQEPTLRVLLVEDSEFDALFLIRYLESNGCHPTHLRVWNQATMEAALDREHWDLVLCDYQMPGFGVLPALELLRRRGLDLPFIVVSGVIGEELAVDLMKAGAHDFIVKGRLSRLLPAIEREVRDAEARRQQALSREKLSYLAAIVDSAEEAIIGQTMEGIITTWNSGAERLYGFSAREAVGQSAGIIVPEDRRQEASELLFRLQQGQVVEQLETVRVGKNGILLDISLTISAIRDSEGRIIGASSIACDVTERKKMEAERTQLIAHLNETLAKVKTLSGLLPICASCKKIRDDHGYWQKLETFVRERSGAEFSHSICPECMERLYPQYAHHLKPERHD